jgi:hypothetical protein
VPLLTLHAAKPQTVAPIPAPAASAPAAAPAAAAPAEAAKK